MLSNHIYRVVITTCSPRADGIFGILEYRCTVIWELPCYRKYRIGQLFVEVEPF